MSRLTARQIAAYLLDRADQYDDDSACWNTLAEAAEEIMSGGVAERVAAGELEDAALLKRVDNFKTGRKRIAIDPRAGTDDTED